MTKEGAKDMIHEALESGWFITKVKGHDHEVIMDFMSTKGSLVNVDLLHTFWW
jgi:hypothetical protein